MRLQATAENWQRCCGRDMAWEIVPGTSGGDRKSSIANGRQPRTTDRQWWCRRRTQVGSGLGVRRLEKFVGQVRRCRSAETLVWENSKLILSPLWDFQPVQPTKERADWSSSLTLGASVGMTGCRLRWRYRSPDVIRPRTLPTTGKRNARPIDGYSAAGAARQSRRKQSSWRVSSSTGPSRYTLPGHVLPLWAWPGPSRLEFEAEAGEDVEWW